MLINPVAEQSRFHPAMPWPRQSPDPLVQRRTGGRNTALLYDSALHCLNAEGNHLLVNVQSNKIGMHRFSPQSGLGGPSGPSLDCGESRTPFTYAFKQ